jgi:hypothetical protein
MLTAYGGGPAAANRPAAYGLAGLIGSAFCLPGAGTTEAVGTMSIRLAGPFVVAGVLLVVRVLRALFGVRSLHARSPEVAGRTTPEQRGRSSVLDEFDEASVSLGLPPRAPTWAT